VNVTESPAPAVIVVSGAGVLSEQPVIQETSAPTITLPVTQKRRLVESAVLFVSAILLLRTVAVEPFGVPTGSMAPSLCGNHRALACPRCGYPIRVGEPTNRQSGYPDTQCLNCGAESLAVAAASEIAGDRLLVDKNVFRLRSPRRWEVAVFICPSDKSKPYVKRIVGLPGEQVRLHDGDVWINGELARKNLSQARGCRIPVFEADYSPPTGWGMRWYPDGTPAPLVASEMPKLPEWMSLDGNALVVNSQNTTAPRLAAYWQVSHDSGMPEVIRDGFEYNGHGSPAHDYAVHDFILECEVEVLAGEGFVGLKLTDGAETATAQIAAGGEFGESKMLVGANGLVKTANRPPLKLGGKYRVEMAFVDRRVSVAVEGKEYFSHDLPAGVRREDVISPFRLGGQGVQLRFDHIRLYRDIFYRAGEKTAAHTPYQLGTDEVLLLGYNSAHVDDSRFWKIPGVPERNFLGKPFLLHQPSRPGLLTVGGKTMHSQSIDWGRIRWLR